MDEALKNKFLDYFAKLPKEGRDAFHALNMDSFIEQTEDARPLEPWQKDTLKERITLQFIGLSDPALLATNIAHDLEIARERAEKIARAVDQNIMQPNAQVLDEILEAVSVKDEVTQPRGDIVPPPATPVPQAPTQKPQSQRIENVEQQVKEKQQNDTLDVFKKRLSAPIHSKVNEESVADKKPGERIGNLEPSSKESIAKDPYKETIE